jgi:teichuronic acid biosynthesis glycosyltransferase TuaC
MGEELALTGITGRTGQTIMKILVVTSVFPNTAQPTLGVFVRERMFKVARHCELKVVAPVPWFPFINLVKKGYRPNVPYLEMQEGIEVYHPRFFNIPRFFKFLDGFCFFLSSVATIRKIRKEFDFDLLDAHFAYPDGVGAVFLGKCFRKPVTITVRGTIRKLARFHLILRQMRYALNNAARIFAVCNDLKNAVTDLGISQEKVVVVPNGVDIDKFKPVDRLAARRELSLPMDSKVLISVGGLVERKGFHRIIAALPEIRQTIPQVMYVIVGGPSVEGNNEPELRRLVLELGVQDAVLFAGPQPHDALHKWLSAADVFCLATSNEGWANVFLEAMACGLPVVTSRVGGNEEVVASDEYGALFDLDDRRQMVEATLKALETGWDRERLVEYARSNSWEKKIDRLMSEFRRIMQLDDSSDDVQVVVN